MENNLRDLDLIQRYFDRSLTEAERQELEYRLKEELALQQLMNEHQQLILGIRYSHLQNKLEQLKALEAVLPKVSDMPRSKTVFLQTYWAPVSIAASILLMVGLWFFQLRDARPLNEKLFADNFEAFDSPGSGLTRSSGNELTLKAQAYEAYDAGQYEKAAALFEKVLNETSDNALMHLCLGNSWLMLDQTNKAEGVFQHMVTDHADLVTQAKWYLALTYLKQAKMERTKATLWEISDSSTYGEKARKLLKDLD